MLAEAIIANMNAETVTADAIKTMIIGHIIASEDDDGVYGPELVSALFSAYQNAACDETTALDDGIIEEGTRDKFVDFREAEKIFQKSFIAGIKYILKCSDDYAAEASSFPDCIPMRKNMPFYSKRIMRELGWALGYREGNRSIAMQKFFKDQASNG